MIFFSHSDFDEFQSSLREAINSDASHDPSSFRSPAIESRLAEERINKNTERIVSQAVSDIMQKIGNAPAAQVPVPGPGGLLQARAAPLQATLQVAAPAAPAEPAAPRPASPVQPRHQPQPQMPNDLTTWRSKRLVLPAFASNYVPDELTSMEKFIAEYLHGTKHRPCLKDIEEYFGPGRRRGKLPSWRSQDTRGRGVRKYDQQNVQKEEIICAD